MRTITSAELNGIKTLAKSMSTKDLKWQISRARSMGIPTAGVKIFKNELATRKD